MTRMMRLAVFSAAVLVTTFALTGCVAPATPPAPKPTPTPTPTLDAAPPTATPTPSPVDPLTTVTALVPRPEVLELRDATGAVVQSLDYLAPAGPAVETLTKVFGAPPVSEEFRGSNHYPPVTVHNWDGFALNEQRYVDRWVDFADDARTLHRPSFSVSLFEPASGVIELTTEHGVHARTAWAELEAMPGIQVNPSGCSGPYLDYIERDETWYDGTVHAQRFGVDFVDREHWDAPTTVTTIRAPMPIYDGCA